MGTQWFCEISGKQIGPLSWEQIRAMAAAGRLKPDDWVRRGTVGSWLPAEGVGDLFSDSDSSTTVRRQAPLPRAKPVASKASPAVASRAEDVPASRPPDDVEVRITDPRSQAAGTRRPDTLRLRRKSRRENMIAGSVVLLVVGLAILGILLALEANSREKRANGRRPAIAQKPSTNLAAAKWIDASHAAIRQGDASVRIASTMIAKPRLLGSSGKTAVPKRPLLMITVEVDNTSKEQDITYAGWNNPALTGRGAKLSDNVGRTYRRKSFPGFRVEGQLPSMSIGPGEKVQDILLFERPLHAVESLRMALPAAAFGGSGTLHFRIPGEMIVVGEQLPGEEAPAGRDTEAEQPPITGVPDADPTIDKPAERHDEKGDAPDLFKDYPELRGEDKPAGETPGFEGTFESFQPSSGDNDGEN